MKSRLLRRAEGQALLEFALILPVLLLLILGILEFGRVWNLMQVVTDVAREGGRRAIIADPSITEQGVKDWMAVKLADAGVPTSAVTITFSGTGANWKHSGDPQTVTVVIPYRFMFFSQVFGQVPLTSSFTMRNE